MEVFLTELLKQADAEIREQMKAPEFLNVQPRPYSSYEEAIFRQERYIRDMIARIEAARAPRTKLQASTAN